MESISHTDAAESIRANNDNLLNMYLFIDDSYVPLVNYRNYTPRNNEGYAINEYWGDDIQGVFASAGIGPRRLGELQSRIARANNAIDNNVMAFTAYNDAVNAWNNMIAQGKNANDLFKGFLLTYVTIAQDPHGIPLASIPTGGPVSPMQTVLGITPHDALGILDAHNHLANAWSHAYSAGFNPIGYLLFFQQTYSGIGQQQIRPLPVHDANRNEIENTFINIDEMIGISSRVSDYLRGHPDMLTPDPSTVAAAAGGGGGGWTQ